MVIFKRGAVWGLVLVGAFAISAIAGTQTREAAEQELEQYRQQIEQNGFDYTVGMNNIMLNYTREERQKLLGLKLPDNWEEIWRANLRDDFVVKSRDELPARFNWEDSGKVSAIKDQEGCGSCWIFSAIGAIESQFMVDFGIEYDLSEQEVLSCYSYDWGCEGGWMTSVYFYVDAFGICDEDALPYYAYDRYPCPDPKPPRTVRRVSYVSVPPQTNAIKTALLEGPVVSSFAVEDAFNGYQSGCFGQIGGEVNHGVVIVGWDDNICEGGGGAWRVKNSWGTDWGDEGYFWVRYTHAHIGEGATQVKLDSTSVVFVECDSLPPGDVCDRYYYLMHCGGGIGDHTWSLVDGALPEGLRLDSIGVLHRYPHEGGNFPLTFEVRDESEPPFTVQKTLNLWIDPIINGDTDCDDILNIMDIVTMVNYKFKGGPEPVYVPASCDTDCDYDCDILDITGMVNYKFKKGPYPCQYQY